MKCLVGFLPLSAEKSGWHGQVGAAASRSRGREHAWDDVKGRDACLEPARDIDGAPESAFGELREVGGAQDPFDPHAFDGHGSSLRASVTRGTQVAAHRAWQQGVCRRPAAIWCCRWAGDSDRFRRRKRAWGAHERQDLRGATPSTAPASARQATCSQPPQSGLFDVPSCSAHGLLGRRCEGWIGERHG